MIRTLPPALFLAAIAASAFAQPASDKPAPDPVLAPAEPAPSDPDAQCAVQSQNAILAMMMRGERAAGHLRGAGNAFAYFSGRLSARHDAAAISPVIAAAALTLQDMEVQMSTARRCFAEFEEANRAVELEFDGARSRPEAPASASSEASPTAVDPDTLCLVTMRGPSLAAPNNRRLGARQQREVGNAFPYYTGRLYARQQPGGALPSLSPLLAGISPQPGPQSIERICIDNAERVIAAIGEAGIDAH